MHTALVNVTLLTLDSARRIIPEGALIFQDERIEAVGPAAELAGRIAQARQTLDGHGMLAMPGFVNAHTHSFQSLLRGLADGLDLIGFLREVVYPITPVMTPEDVRLGAALSVLEAIKSGTTCLVDNHSGDTSLAATDGIAQVFAESGMRGLIARGLRQPTPRARAWHVPEHAFQFSLAEELEITRDLIERWRHAADGRVQVCPAPLTLFLASPDDLRAAKALADEYAAPLHIHVAETQSEVDATLQDYGCREVEHLAQVGVLDRRFHVVHGVWLDEREMDMLAESGGHVVHCPTSNMSLASGVAPIPEMLARGVNVALASDGLGNHNHDMFSVLKTTSLLHRVHTLQPDVLSSEQILEMATLGGARALGLENEIGSLEVGKCADFFAVNLNRLELAGAWHDPVAALVFCSPVTTDYTVVGGKFVIKHGELVTLDQVQLVERHNNASQRLLID